MFDEMLNDFLENYPNKFKNRKQAKRRENYQKHFKRKAHIAKLCGYKPNTYYWAFNDDIILPNFPIFCRVLKKSNTYDPLYNKPYLKRGGSSKRSQYLKRRSSKIIRKLPVDEVVGKGNAVNKYFDYDWELY